ncbi:hypothetical protein AMJ57_01490 [Parcubacteria bacterium SG8_24]|nr:MAG: hypothetical protein AMJ57_01490 [Parcubacteria bacterium SG8_24]
MEVIRFFSAISDSCRRARFGLVGSCLAAGILFCGSGAKAGDPPPSGDPKVGDVLPVTEFHIADIMNPDPVSQGGRKLRFGDSCSAHEGNRVEVVGLHKDRILLRYRRTDSRDMMGCPDGILYFRKRDELLKGLAAYRLKRLQEARQKELVRRLLREESTCPK